MEGNRTHHARVAGLLVAILGIAATGVAWAGVKRGSKVVTPTAHAKLGLSQVKTAYKRALERGRLIGTSMPNDPKLAKLGVYGHGVPHLEGQALSYFRRELVDREPEDVYVLDLDGHSKVAAATFAIESPSTQGDRSNRSLAVFDRKTHRLLAKGSEYGFNFGVFRWDGSKEAR